MTNRREGQKIYRNEGKLKTFTQFSIFLQENLPRTSKKFWDRIYLCRSMLFHVYQKKTIIIIKSGSALIKPQATQQLVILKVLFQNNLRQMID